MFKNRVLPFFLVACGAIAFAASSQKHEFKDGILTGKILDLTGKPVPDATVALKGPGGKVLSWGKTDANGEYRLAANPKLALNLSPSHCRSLLQECCKAVGDVAMDTVRTVGAVVVTPGPVVHGGAVAVASGTSGAEVAQSQVPQGNVVGQTSQAAGGAATDAALTPHKGALPPPEQHGLASLLVTAPGFQEASVNDPAYWMAPPNDDRSDPVGVEAWLQTVKIAPTASKDKCAIMPAAITLSDLDVQPPLVPAGSSLAIKVKLNIPTPDPTEKMRVFARLASKGTVVELTPVQGQKDTYGGNLTVDPKTPPGETVVCIGALREDPIEFKLNPKKGDALLEFAKRSDDMNGSKPYGYDPFVMASQNRLDAKVTVLAGKPAS